MFTLLGKLIGVVITLFKTNYQSPHIYSSIEFSTIFLNQFYVFLMIKMQGKCKLHQSWIDFLEVHSPLCFSWHFIIFIFDTCRICSRSIVIFICDSTRAYTFCKCSTKVFVLEYHVIYNGFQFIMSNKMTWLVSIFNVELVSLIKQWILLVVSSLQIYPFNIFPMWLEPPTTPMIIVLKRIFLFRLLFYLI